jgi:hypothetical protein
VLYLRLGGQCCYGALLGLQQQPLGLGPLQRRKARELSLDVGNLVPQFFDLSGEIITLRLLGLSLICGSIRLRAWGLLLVSRSICLRSRWPGQGTRKTEKHQKSHRTPEHSRHAKFHCATRDHRVHFITLKLELS